MPLPAFRTLGTLRSVLQARLGFGAAGGSAGVNRVLLDDFLFQAQKELYYLGDWFALSTYADVALGTSQLTFDYPATIDPYRISKITLEINASWVKLDEFLEDRHWTTMDSPGPPQRFERMAQIQLWPITDQAYTIRVYGIQPLDRFSEDGDRPIIDDAMIMLHAVTHAKEHYRQPDAPNYRKDLDLLLGRIAGKSHRIDGVYRRDQTKYDYEPRPRVI